MQNSTLVPSKNNYVLYNFFWGTCLCTQSIKIVLFTGILILLSIIVGCEQENNEQTNQDTNMKNNANIRTLSVSPLEFKPIKFEAAIKAYIFGNIKGENGVVQLPDDFARLTVDGCIYVTKNCPSGTLYLFITWKGKGSNLRGYLYRQKINQNSSSVLKGRIKVLASTIWKPGYGKIDVDVEGMSRAGWYKVKRDWD